MIVWEQQCISCSMLLRWMLIRHVLVLQVNLLSLNTIMHLTVMCQTCSMKITNTEALMHAHTHTIVLWSFVWDYLGEPYQKKTFTHSDLSWSSTILYQLPPSTTIHNILPVQFMCFTVFLNNLSNIHWLSLSPVACIISATGPDKPSVLWLFIFFQCCSNFIYFWCNLLVLF